MDRPSRGYRQLREWHGLPPRPNAETQSTS